VFECVINISEGRDVDVLDELCDAAHSSLRDLHSCEFHHRSVFTLINDDDALVRDVRSLIDAAFERLDLTTHEGVHPRFGVVDVVPFVALQRSEAEHAVLLRDEMAHWIATTYEVPVFLYGPLSDHTIRTLPEVRKSAFTSLAPDVGPASASSRLGSVAVGARDILVAWNLWLNDVTLDHARLIAKEIRQPALRTLAFAAGDAVQVSCNIIDVETVLPSQVYDQVRTLLPEGGKISRSELVGLVPRALLEREEPARWVELGLSRDATIEERIINWHG
jgi:glutamate formiminotransferase